MKKEEQIRMLLNSEQYTEEQLDKMLEDSHIPAPNVDKEWQRFKTKTQATSSIIKSTDVPFGRREPFA